MVRLSDILWGFLLSVALVAVITLGVWIDNIVDQDAASHPEVVDQSHAHGNTCAWPRGEYGCD